MPNWKDLQDLLEARFQTEQAEPEKRIAAQGAFDNLVEQVCQETNRSRNTLLEAIAHRYRQYRRDRLAQERREGRGQTAP